MAAQRFIIHGEVQGVGYRYFTLREAEALGLTGYVRNLPDGTVEVVAEGSAERLRGLEARLTDGPPFAGVTSVERVAVEPQGWNGFQIRP